MNRLMSQARLEVALTLRRGESLLVTIGIPVGILVFFTVVDVLPHPGRAIDFLTPGVLAISVVSSAMTSSSIATGFERHAGVLRRLATTPLGRGGLLGAKVVSLVVVLFVQLAVIVGVAVALGWRPEVRWLDAIAAFAFGIAAFAGLGFLLAGRLRAETNLAVSNALFLVFLLLGGIVVPLDRLPEGAAAIARLLPAEPLATALRDAAAGQTASPGGYVTLVVWAVLGCALAVRTFRWD